MNLESLLITPRDGRYLLGKLGADYEKLLPPGTVKSQGWKNGHRTFYWIPKLDCKPQRVVLNRHEVNIPGAVLVNRETDQAESEGGEES